MITNPCSLKSFLGRLGDTDACGTWTVAPADAAAAADALACTCRAKRRMNRGLRKSAECMHCMVCVKCEGVRHARQTMLKRLHWLLLPCSGSRLQNHTQHHVSNTVVKTMAVYWTGDHSAACSCTSNGDNEPPAAAAEEAEEAAEEAAVVEADEAPAAAALAETVAVVCATAAATVLAAAAGVNAHTHDTSQGTPHYSCLVGHTG